MRISNSFNKVMRNSSRKYQDNATTPQNISLVQIMSQNTNSVQALKESAKHNSVLVAPYRIHTFSYKLEPPIVVRQQMPSKPFRIRKTLLKFTYCACREPITNSRLLFPLQSNLRNRNDIGFIFGQTLRSILQHYLEYIFYHYNNNRKSFFLTTAHLALIEFSSHSSVFKIVS